MTETNDTNIDSNDNSAGGEPPASDRQNPAAQKPEKKPNRRTTRRTLLVLVWLLTLGLVSAIGFGSWYVWHLLQAQNQELSELGAELDGQAQGLEQQGQALEQQSRRLDQMPDNLEQQLTQSFREQRSAQDELLNNMEQRLNRIDRRLGAIASTNREDWKLAEAEYLLRLANQRLVLERDSQNALALAQTADGILRDLGDSDLLPVRRALASDIQALTLAGRVDREGLYVQLLALGEQIPKLPLVEPLSGREATSSNDNEAEGSGAEETEAAGVWNRIKQSFGRVMQRLSNHIRIHRHEEPLTALADPREQFYLRQQLQLMLEQAQAALLREETDIFRTSLTRAAQWLEQHYTLNPQTQEVRATLLELAETEIAPQLPDLNGALNLLEEHIEQLHRLSPDFQQAPGEDLGEESDS